MRREKWRPCFQLFYSIAPAAGLMVEVAWPAAREVRTIAPDEPNLCQQTLSASRESNPRHDRNSVGKVRQ